MGIVANNGVLFSESALKGAHFIEVDPSCRWPWLLNVELHSWDGDRDGVFKYVLVVYDDANDVVVESFVVNVRFLLFSFKISLVLWWVTDMKLKALPNTARRWSLQWLVPMCPS